jgi:Do/DeqQ family serine protease
MKRLTNILLIAVLTAIIVVGFSLGSDKNSDESRAAVQPETVYIPAKYTATVPFEGPDFTNAAEKTVNAVVHIRSEFLRRSTYDEFFAPFREFFGEPYGGGERTYSGYGSGVILSEDGYIVTNNHVVEGANYIEVTLNDKREYEAEIIGTDPQTDLALIKIKSEELPFVIYGNSDDVKIGEWVLAVGNPFNLTSTVTAGIVSAKARNINILGIPGAIESFIQTDAAVNRGNSGGALVNTEGELIGINAAIASNTGAYTGYSFAIPVNIVKKVVDDLMVYGGVQRAFIGVIIREVNASLAEEKDLESVRGVYVERTTENGGAEEAGMEPGDIIISIDGMDINTTAQLLEVVGQHTPGDQLDVMVLRDDRQKEFRVELKNEDGNTLLTRQDDDFYSSDLGATFEPVDQDTKDQLGITHGMQIKDVNQGMISNGGIKEGFIITAINNIKITSRQDLDYAMKNVKGGVIRIEGVYPDGMRMNYGFIR